MSSPSSAGATPEWTPSYLRSARTAADRAAGEAGEFDDVDLAQMAIAAAVRGLAAEVRALRHQLTGATPPRGGGALGVLKDIEHSIDLTTPS